MIGGDHLPQPETFLHRGFSTIGASHTPSISSSLRKEEKLLMRSILNEFYQMSGFVASGSGITNGSR
jgi:hypothetical protein